MPCSAENFMSPCLRLGVGFPLGSRCTMLKKPGHLWTHREDGLREELVQFIFRFDIGKRMDGCSGQERVSQGCPAMRRGSVSSPSNYTCDT